MPLKCSSWLCHSFVRLVFVISCINSLGIQAGHSEIEDGDRVAFLGDTLFERAVRYGRIETALTARWPDRKIVFRNIGWSGDAPNGRARVFFGDLEEGWTNLNKHLDLANPNVVFLAYGAMASFDGEKGLDAFIDQMGVLMDTLEKREIRIVLVSPTPRENMGPPLPDPETQNRNLALYNDALKLLAQKRSTRFIDLFNTLETRSPSRNTKAVTDNGVHLNDYGYLLAGERMAQSMDDYLSVKRLTLDRKGAVKDSEGLSLLDADLNKSGLEIRILDDRLSQSSVDGDFSRNLTLTLTNLPRGNYRLEHEGVVLATGAAAQWKRGIQLAIDPSAKQSERLREAINRKNDHFFHQWRPQNETYIRGFRKHEQGQNAADLPKFQPFIEAEEMKIESLKKPKPYTLTLTRIEGGDR